MKFLFLGDSITDCEHCFTADNLGNGYVKYFANALMEQYPVQFGPSDFVNGGTDGFTIRRIRRKWQQMYRGQTFDCVFILGGINDVAILADTRLTPAQYEQQLTECRMELSHLLEDLIADGIKHLYVLEPFLFPGSGYLKFWEPVRAELWGQICAEIQGHLSSSCDTVHVLRLQDLFDRSFESSQHPSLSPDGVHLTAFGHQFLSEKLLYYIEKIRPKAVF